MTLPPIPGQRSTDDNGLLTAPWFSWFTQLVVYLTASSLPVGKSTIRSGSVAPNGVVTGNVGDLYLNTSGGASTTLWVKESGAATNTGWIGK